MLVVDASCLVEVLTGTARGELIRQRLAADEDQAAPHIVDVEVFGIIRREHQRDRLDRTAAAQAVAELAAWPGERFDHRTAPLPKPTRPTVAALSVSRTAWRNLPTPHLGGPAAPQDNARPVTGREWRGS